MSQVVHETSSQTSCFQVPVGSEFPVLPPARCIYGTRCYFVCSGRKFSHCYWLFEAPTFWKGQTQVAARQQCVFYFLGVVQNKCGLIPKKHQETTTVFHLSCTRTNNQRPFKTLGTNKQRLQRGEREQKEKTTRGKITLSEMTVDDNHPRGMLVAPLDGGEGHQLVKWSIGRQGVPESALLKNLMPVHFQAKSNHQQNWR